MAFIFKQVKLRFFELLPLLLLFFISLNGNSIIDLKFFDNLKESIDDTMKAILAFKKNLEDKTKN